MYESFVNLKEHIMILDKTKKRRFKVLFHTNCFENFIFLGICQILLPIVSCVLRP